MSERTRPKIGQSAPDFDLPASGGLRVSLAELRAKPSGHAVVLYFYPKDDTSGCTREALDFSAELAAFEDAGAIIIGVSKDPVRKHDKFIEKYGLGIALASDADSDLCERYGTWVEKSMYGRRYMGIERSTFLIDAAGILRHEWRKVKLPGHVAEVLAAVQTL